MKKSASVIEGSQEVRWALHFKNADRNHYIQKQFFGWPAPNEDPKVRTFTTRAQAREANRLRGRHSKVVKVLVIIRPLS